MVKTAKPKTRERVRDAERSKELILDAAEHLFAERGYEETSLSDVGERAGVSRATPGYFFGSKADLHRAVLERCFADVRRAVRYFERVLVQRRILRRDANRSERHAAERRNAFGDIVNVCVELGRDAVE